MKLKKRAKKAIGRFLELKGCEILEEGWCHGKDKVDYIIDDYGCIAFVFGHAEENAGKGIPAKPVDRKRFERLAAAYLTEHPDLVDCEVRADEASILILSDTRAVIRHYVNALGAVV